MITYIVVLYILVIIVGIAAAIALYMSYKNNVAINNIIGREGKKLP